MRILRFSYTPRALLRSLILTFLAISVLGVFTASVLATEQCPKGSVATECAPGWGVTAHTYPSRIGAGHDGAIEVEVLNLGAGSSGPVTVTDTLPKGVTAIEAGDWPGLQSVHDEPEAFVVKNEHWGCTGPEGASVQGASVVTCVEPEGLLGGAGIAARGEIALRVEVEEAPAPGEENHVVVSGGGAPAVASTSDPVSVGPGQAPFGFDGFDVVFSNANGTLDTQAGSHPYAMALSFDLSTALEQGVVGLPNEARNVEVLLPPGFVGNPTAVPQCTRAEFLNNNCPAASEIGVLLTLGPVATYEQVYNLVPPPSSAADFGVRFGEGINGYIYSQVRSGGDYGITSNSTNIPQRADSRYVLMLWGVPGDQTHDRWRSAKGDGEGCSQGEVEQAGNACSQVESPMLKPFLTLPTQCGEPLKFTIRATSWQHQDLPAIEKTIYWHDSNGLPMGIIGCEALRFAPLISTQPDTARADTPTGLTVEVKPPVGGLEEPEGLSASDIKDTAVLLPKGLVINPGQAAGLGACPHGPASSEPGAERYGDNLPLPGEDGNEARFEGPSNCPGVSKVGTVEIESPLIEGDAQKLFRGSVYVLQSNPPQVELLLAASADGVNLKLVGEVHLCEAAGQMIAGKTCEAAGQIVSTFEKTPGLPFTDFRLSFSGGPQAALDTPTQCGSHLTNADFTPWSEPFVNDFLATASFDLTEGPGGAPCPSSPLPFTPELTAGATTDQAGGFTNFSLLLQRPDGQQRIERLRFKAPEGLGGMLSAVPLCGEPQAAQGACSSVSQIGHASVASGPGPYPLVLPQPGAPELPIYLTGPYDGAPFGLSIVTPVIAGPFNLGTIVTRARIEIDPHTAQIMVTTDPLPQVVKGVPTDLRLVDAVIDRAGFMFNPTNCTPQSFSGTAWGTPPPGAGGPGVSAPISSHFGVGSCRELAFHPKLTVSASGRNSKANGASLTAKVAYPSAAQGTQTNIGLVKVDLPKQLPSRLTTLQKACTLAQFEANPAGCPSASFMGTRSCILPSCRSP
jgi:hypothetical protein